MEMKYMFVNVDRPGWYSSEKDCFFVVDSEDDFDSDLYSSFDSEDDYR